MISATRFGAVVALALYFAIAAITVVTPAVGFRGDGSGVYANATPPTIWDIKAGTNVVWKADLPASTTASPIVVDGKLIVVCEPDIVVCYDAQTGKLLWQKSGGAFDYLGEEKAKRANELFAQLRELEGKGKANLNDKTSEYALAAHEFGALTGIGLHYWPAFSTPTASSDGVNIAIRTPVGPVVCYDMDGNLKWAEKVKSLSRMAPCSPLMLKGQIITFDGTNLKLRVFDAATGKMVWDIPVGRGHYKYATPALFHLGDNDYIFTDSGDVVTTDGKIVAAGLLHMDGSSSPIVVDGVAYANEAWNPGGLTAVQLSIAADKVEGKKLWTAKARLGGSSPSVYDGLVYLLDSGGLLVVLDAKTGEIVYQQPKEKDIKGLDASLAIANGMIYVPNSKGEIRVFKAGRKPELVATNISEPIRSSPFCAGERIYLTGRTTLYAISTK
ncbi:MAG: PQQ-binding-like beta-propeller repeat protein [bacterium]